MVFALFARSFLPATEGSRGYGKAGQMVGGWVTRVVLGDHCSGGWHSCSLLGTSWDQLTSCLGQVVRGHDAGQARDPKMVEEVGGGGRYRSLLVRKAEHEAHSR